MSERRPLLRRVTPLLLILDALTFFLVVPAVGKLPDAVQVCLDVVAVLIAFALIRELPRRRDSSPGGEHNSGG